MPDPDTGAIDFPAKFMNEACAHFPLSISSQAHKQRAAHHMNVLPTFIHKTFLTGVQIK